MWIFLLCLLVGPLVPLDAVPTVQKGVTNEDIRDAILSLVLTLRTIDDKLERHEFRERAFAEHVKKSFASLDKRTKFLESVKGTVGRLDERLAGVETFLIDKDAKTWQLKETIEEIAKKKLPETINQLNGKLENVSKIVKKLDTNVEKLTSDTSTLKSDNEKFAQNSETLLRGFEQKLSHFNDKVHTEIVPIDYKDQNGAMKKTLDEQQNNINDILREVLKIESKINGLPDKEDLQRSQNITLDSLEELHDLAVAQSDKTASILEYKFDRFSGDLDKKHDDLLKSVNELSEMAENISETVSTSMDHLKKDLAPLPRLEEVLMQTADGLIDTKRRVEFGVHQILLEVGELVKESGEKINQTIQERFDNFELTVLDAETGALANLTSKIGSNIDQVWRQISIMHQQMSASTDTLNNLQNQTDTYVSGSLTVMDSMKSKVGQITQRMAEVEENLNSLMGRLSLVTQEFNRIKGGLGKALDEIRASFVQVQEKIKDNGPGPHTIPPDSEERLMEN